MIFLNKPTYPNFRMNVHALVRSFPSQAGWSRTQSSKCCGDKNVISLPYVIIANRSEATDTVEKIHDEPHHP